jgi:hypothetical protein
MCPAPCPLPPAGATGASHHSRHDSCSSVDGEAGELPVVMLHGVGLGCLAYCSLVGELVKTGARWGWCVTGIHHAPGVGYMWFWGGLGGRGGGGGELDCLACSGLVGGNAATQ